MTPAPAAARLPALALVPLLLLGAAACDTKSKLDAQKLLADRIATVNDCFPELWEAADKMVQHAQTWGRNDTVDLPPGFGYSLLGDGRVTAAFPLTDGTVSLTIVFYSPDGTAQDLGLVDNGDFEDLIDQAATALANQFGGQDPFMVGTWQIGDSPTISGSGSFTGIIGGTTNQNELEELRTTTGTPAGGPPPVADARFDELGGAQCKLTFRIPSLQTDVVPNQRYPIGTITIVLQGAKATVNAQLVFDGTVVAVLTVDGVPGTFSVNLDTYDVSRNE